MMVTALAVLPVASGQWICPARFEPLPEGWVPQRYITTLGMPSFAANTFAHTRGFNNLNDIKRDGIYVSVSLSHHRIAPAPTWRRPLRLPLNVQYPHQVTRQEGSSLPEYRFAGRFRDLYYVDLRIAFGRRHPTSSMLSRSQALINRLRLPTKLLGRRAAC